MPPSAPWAWITISWSVWGKRVTNSLKEPSAWTSAFWPLMVSLAKGSVMPLTCAMRPRTSTEFSRKRGPSPQAVSAGG
jgi:hypothetical protein